MMKNKILITTTDTRSDIIVSGISSVVKRISSNTFCYKHFVVGTNHKKFMILKICLIFLQLIRFPFEIHKNDLACVHLNVALNPISLLREFIFSIMCDLNNTKYLVHFHGGRYFHRNYLPWYTRFMLKKLAQGSIGLIFLNNSELLWWRKNFGYVQTNLNVLGNPAPTVNYLKNKSGKIKKFKCIYFGRLAEEKGLLELIQTFSKINNATLSVYGSGELEGKVKSLCTRCTNIQFEGLLTDLKQLVDYDIFILTSKYGEGMPMALLEAMSYGLFPIVSDDGAMGDMVRSTNFGHVLEKWNVDPASLQQHIDKFNSITTAEIQQLQNRIQQDFGVEKYNNDLTDLTKRLLYT